ncbi:MAG: YdcF family protein [Bacteroidota bacterium]|nr:YdcF family protein [Bacteroidota bacterium]
MFFIVSKIFSYLLTPVFWVLALLIVSLIVKNKRLSKRLILLSVVLFYLLSNHYLVDVFLRSWEYPVQNLKADSSRYDVGIVLGGDIITYNKDDKRLIFRNSADRGLQALQLYKQGRIKKILITAGPGSLMYPDEYESNYYRNYLISVGVPSTDIISDSLANNTRQNAVNSKAILEKACPNGKYLLITSALHMRRSLGCYRKVGLKVTPYAVGRLSTSPFHNIEYLFIPDTDALQYWSLLMHEWVGYWIYRIAGYI